MPGDKIVGGKDCFCRYGKNPSIPFNEKLADNCSNQDQILMGR